MSWDLDDYEPVADRLAAFHSRHIAGKVITEILSTEAQHDAGLFIVKASVFRGDELRDDRPAATGLAAELASKTGVNSTSPLENCETSAIGRALANLGFAAKKSARASREEMEKIARMSEPGETAEGSSDAIGGTPGSDQMSESRTRPSVAGNSDAGQAVSTEGLDSGTTSTEGEATGSSSGGGPGTNPSVDDNCDHDWRDTWVDKNGVTKPVHPDYLCCAKCKRTEKKSKLLKVAS